MWRGGNWQISISLGKLYQGQRRHKEAEQAFAAARTIIEELARTIEDQALRDTFMQQASRMVPQTRSLTAAQATKQAYSGLSAREREVAVLIAQGKSNREIAAWAIEKGLTREKA